MRVRGRSRRGGFGLAVLLAVLCWPAAAQNEAILVDNLADEGPGSLRAAIELANDREGHDQILVAVPGQDATPTILLASPLPPVTGPVEISGTVTRGGPPVLDGTAVGGVGLQLEAPTTLRGLELVGFDTGVEALPGADGSVIGDPTGDEPVVLRDTTGDAIEVVGDVHGVVIRGISAVGHGGLAIDLEPDPSAAGAPGNPNLNDPGDNDGGPNNGQNAPTLILEPDGGDASIVGLLLSEPSTDYTIDIYRSTECQPTSGTAHAHIGVLTATTDAEGLALFRGALDGPVDTGDWLTATATGPHGTSELSPCGPVLLPAAGPTPGPTESPAPTERPTPPGSPTPPEDPGATPSPAGTSGPTPTPTATAVPPSGNGSAGPAGSSGASSGGAPPSEAAPPPLPVRNTAQGPGASGVPGTGEDAVDPLSSLFVDPLGADDGGVGAPTAGDLPLLAGDATAPHPEAIRAPRRAAFANAVPLPSSELLAPGTIARAVTAVVALVLALGFSSALFNETLKHNRATIHGWFRAADPVVDRVRRFMQATPVGVGVAGLLLTRAVLFCFVDPGFPSAPYSGRLFAGMFIGSTVVVGVVYGLLLALEHRRTGQWGRLQAVPLGLVVALLCLAATRLFDFVPGYLFGVTVAISLPVPVSTERSGVLNTRVFSVVIPTFFAAYLLRGVLTSAVAVPDPSFAAEVADIALGFLAVGGCQYALFLLLPMTGMNGGAIFAWSRMAWARLFIAAVALFVLVVPDPRSGMWQRTSASGVLGLALGFGLFSLAFWAYFRYRRPAPPKPRPPWPPPVPEHAVSRR